MKGSCLTATHHIRCTAKQDLPRGSACWRGVASDDRRGRVSLAAQESDRCLGHQSLRTKSETVARPAGFTAVLRALSLAFVSGALAAEDGDIARFLGRFHMLVVHLPIGVLIAAAAMDCLAWWRRRSDLAAAGVVLWRWGAVVAWLSVVLGLLLARDGGYDTQALGWHQWTGIACAVGATLMGLTRSWQARAGGVVAGGIAGGLGLATIILLFAAGHFGGSLTHGSQFLVRYAPWGVEEPDRRQRSPSQAAEVLVADGSEPDDTSKAPSPRREEESLLPDPDGAMASAAADDAVVTAPVAGPAQGPAWADVQAIMERYCVDCHGESKRKAGLRLDGYDHTMAGADGDPVIYAGNPERSILLELVELPLDDPDVMPPDGAHLSEEEIDLIRTWIGNGAVRAHAAAEATVTAAPAALPPASPTEYALLAEQLPAPDTDLIASLVQAAVRIDPLTEDGRVLAIDASYAELANAELWQRILQLEGHVARLDVGRRDIDDQALLQIGRLSNLRVLNLEETGISHAGLAPLAELEHLRQLNLTGTAVDNRAVALLQRLGGLERCYLWRTSINRAGIRRLQDALPACAVVGGGSGLLPGD